MNIQHTTQRAFTLFEVLIVVIILGVIAAMVIPNFASAVEDTSANATKTELLKLRRAVEVYRVRNDNALPNVTTGVGTWGALIENNGEYLREAPVNPYIVGGNQSVIVIGANPDAAYQTTHGWIYNNLTGEVWAGGFDENDEPLARP